MACDIFQATWPPSLKTFILQSQQLSLPRSIPPSVAMTTVDISSKIKAGMTPKKSHEVSQSIVDFFDFIELFATR